VPGLNRLGGRGKSVDVHFLLAIFTMIRSPAPKDTKIKTIGIISSVSTDRINVVKLPDDSKASTVPTKLYSKH